MTLHEILDDNYHAPDDVFFLSILMHIATALAITIANTQHNAYKTLSLFT